MKVDIVMKLTKHCLWHTNMTLLTINGIMFLKMSILIS